MKKPPSGRLFSCTVPQTPLYRSLSFNQESTVAKPVTPQEQDWFYERLRNAKVEVQLFLVNGVRLIGRIDHIDRYTVLLSKGPSSQVVYKHAISTVVPPTGFEIGGPDS
jgi:host factor-I protein